MYSDEMQQEFYKLMDMINSESKENQEMGLVQLKQQGFNIDFLDDYIFREERWFENEYVYITEHFAGYFMTITRSYVGGGKPQGYVLTVHRISNYKKQIMHDFRKTEPIPCQHETKQYVKYFSNQIIRQILSEYGVLT